MKITIETEPKELVETVGLLDKVFSVIMSADGIVRTIESAGKKIESIEPVEGHAYGAFTEGYHRCSEGIPTCETIGMGRSAMGVGRATMAGGTEYGE